MMDSVRGLCGVYRIVCLYLPVFKNVCCNLQPVHKLFAFCWTAAFILYEPKEKSRSSFQYNLHATLSEEMLYSQRYLFSNC
jgi:hypothetical protein